jgi:hypothetical protein
MGVRAGQGFGVPKPKRGLCPGCARRGLTQWRATAYGMLRWCQYCQHSEGQGVFDMVTAGRWPGARPVTTPTKEKGPEGPLEVAEG